MACTCTVMVFTPVRSSVADAEMESSVTQLSSNSTGVI